MKTRMVTTAAVIGLLIALSAGELLAAGRGNGGGKGQSNGTCTSQQAGTGSSSATRPVGSQRRDGTFLTTGTTANGATSRPNNGKGLQDGSRLNTATTPATTP
ncbi:hypothetical protein KI809_19350 [Geobacter pelophilus]|uniref:Uncharacterized protein n=1 Tax=Geoanaerobacter pelophilus TaxID=60036 RepID=A0AAW4LA41_9BACT|nr:hypothetical protein [Geoanaerobacter pelophilus]MBT0666470.1 hypothetical protein [Geoanaerobacter pelophilus]